MSLDSLRPFRSQPLYALACAATLALAVATATTSAAVVKQAFFDPLPYADDERLIAVQTATDNGQSAMSIFVVDDLRRAPQQLLTSVAAFRFASPTYQAADLAQSVDAQEVGLEYFETLGVRPVLGGVWASGDPNAVVVSWRFWQRWLSADPAAIGRTIVLDGVSRQVTGVMPAAFLAPWGPQVDLWQPLDERPLLADTARARRTVSVVARLAPGVTLLDARTFMAAFSERQRAQYPAIHARESWVVESLREQMVGPARPVLIGTGAAALLLLLIVWANIACLAAVNAAAHRQRYAIRAALGASATRIFRERLRESLAISMAGSLAGLGLAYGLIRVVTQYQQVFLPTFSPASFDWSTAVLGLCIGVATGVFAALAPHGAMTRLQVEDPLRSARGSTGDTRLATLRSILVFVQVAVTIVLIVGAGLLVRTVGHLAATSIGYDSGSLSYFFVSLPLPSYRASERQITFDREVRERIGQIAGITAVSASVGFPVMGGMGARLTILNQAQPEAAPEIAYYSVTPQFFSFLDVPILQGRDIAEADDFPASRVVVVNETMARLFWPEGNAIGAKVKIGAGAATDREITIVGIAADVRQHGPTQDVRPTAYGSTLQYSWPRRHIGIRTDRPVAQLGQQVRAAVHAIDPAVASSTLTPIDEVVARQTARHRLVMLTLAFFGTVAILLCGLGLYAAVALNSQFRRREYAIRVALGSSRQRVCWLVARQALAIAVAGAVAGLFAASASTRVLQGLLHGVTPLDGPTFAAAFAAIVVLAGIAASLPAWRSGRVDPTEALRAD